MIGLEPTDTFAITLEIAGRYLWVLWGTPATDVDTIPGALEIHLDQITTFGDGHVPTVEAIYLDEGQFVDPEELAAAIEAQFEDWFRDEGRQPHCPNCSASLSTVTVVSECYQTYYPGSGSYGSPDVGESLRVLCYSCGEALPEELAKQIETL